MASFGFAPYQESSIKSALRLAAIGGGLGSIPRGANFGEALLGSFAGGLQGRQKAQQAAMEYAQRQSELQRQQEMDDLNRMNIESQIKARERPEPEPKIPGKQQDYEHLINDLGMEPVKARQIVYGLTPEEQATLKAKERPPKDVEDMSWISGYVKTTRSGLKFLDASEMSGKDKGEGLRWAAKQGLPVAGSVELGQLQDIDAARGNIGDIKAQMESILPRDPQGRVAAYPGIKLSQIFQTAPSRSAFLSWRGAAIRNFRAVAGSKGLRLNQKEIDLAVKNDIPEITDTYEVALRKLGVVEKGLANAERSLLQKNWGSGGPPAAPASGASHPLDRFIK